VYVERVDGAHAAEAGHRYLDGFIHEKFKNTMSKVSMRSILDASRPTAEPDTGVETTSGGGPTGPRIRCPKCKWSPRGHELWQCKCGHRWHTFDTGGVCPACLYQWQVTQCFQCVQYSPHSDWYARE
jgi:hypothetical protein